jgi:Replication-relaxation
MSRPLAGPPALSAAPHNPRGCTVLGAQLPTQETRTPVRVSSQLAEATAGRLSARDWEVLRTTGRFQAMSGAQLRELYWPEGTPQTRARLARRGLARLASLEVLAPLSRRIGGVRAGSSGLVFAVGRLGQRLLAVEAQGSRRSRQPYLPTARRLDHLLAVAQLYTDLVAAARWGVAEVLAFDPEPACWVKYAGAFMAKHTLKPDAFVRLGVGEYEYHWWVEVDRGTVSLATVKGQAQHYLECWRADGVRGVFPRVAWVVADEPRATSVRRTLGCLPEPANKLFMVTLHGQAVASLTAEAGA